jgi:diapolycopene oxygenase
MQNKKAIIIGSGIAGIATSIRLRIKGYEVLVLEANSYPGGKLTEIRQGGYRFDAGPSLFTMPHYVDELFVLAGKNPRKHFNYIRANESCRYFWDDGTRLTAWDDIDKFASETEQVLGVPKKHVISRLKSSAEMYETAGRIFMEKPLNKLSTWLSKDVARSLVRLHKLGIFTSMHRDNQRILAHPKLVQLFDRYATYNGSDPYRAPAILNMIPHLEHNIGTFIPEKGMHQITESLVDLATELGVTFNYNSRVHEIVLSNNTARAVRTDDGQLQADIIVSNMDITPTYRRLLPSVKAPELSLRQERSSSALIFYWGIKKTFAALGPHNIFFSRDYKTEFEEIFNNLTPASDPTIYVHITAKEIPADAPDGCENWFVMLNVPGYKNHDWEKLVPAYRQAILNKINPILETNLQPFIEHERTLTPLDIELKTSSLGGSLYGTSSNSRFAAFLRHANKSSRIRNLYFCGGSVHPGGGIPLCLLSAKIVSELCPSP